MVRRDGRWGSVRVSFCYCKSSNNACFDLIIDLFGVTSTIFCEIRFDRQYIEFLGGIITKITSLIKFVTMILQALMQNQLVILLVSLVALLKHETSRIGLRMKFHF